MTAYEREFPNRDTKEEFPRWFEPKIRQLYIKNDPSCTNELFALACGPSSTPISVNSCVVNGVSNEGRRVKRCVTRNNITLNFTANVSFKDPPYILGTQAKQIFYLEDPARRLIHWKVVKDAEVEAPDEDDDFIDDEDDVPHDLADSKNEVLANSDDDEVAIVGVYSSDEEIVMDLQVARGHGGDGDGDPPRPLYRSGSGFQRSGGKRCKGGNEDKKGVRKGTFNIELKKAVENYGSQKINIEWRDQETFRHVGVDHVWFQNYVGELIREFLMHYQSWYDIPESEKAHVHGRSNFFDLDCHMRGPHWGRIETSIEDSFAKCYSDNKHNFKRDHWTLKGGAAQAEEIRSHPSPNVEQSVWDQQVDFWIDPKMVHRATMNAQNRRGNMISSRHGSGSLVVT
ncbi:hypothetical protein Tco_1288015 [Tanacetum coccineum]